MNLHSVLLTGIAIATVAWAMAFEAQAQTTTPAPTEQSVTTTRDTAATPKKTKHHSTHALPSTDSTPSEKAATDSLNTQQMQAVAPSSHQTGAPQPGTIATGAIPDTGTAPNPPPVPNPDTSAQPPQ